MKVICVLIAIIILILFDIIILNMYQFNNSGAMLHRYVETSRDYKIEHTFRATVTAYSPTVDQCDDTPFLTAFQTPVRRGIIAVSRDIEKEYHLNKGDKVAIENMGIFYFYDRMSSRWTNRIDVFMWDRQDCLEFGIKELEISIIKEYGA